MNKSRLVFLIALTLTLQMIGLPQPLTGPMVNMMLILAVLFVSPRGAILLGALTPLVALLRGQLPAPLILLIPFIMTGNAIYALLYAVLSRAKRQETASPLFELRSWIALLVASFAKFIWLYAAARHLVPLLLNKPFPPALLAMMSLPQFITAMLGGALALLLYNILQRRFRLK